jgi:D-glycero-D-manno-heptose 1,7-bisphosphate phosphatase
MAPKIIEKRPAVFFDRDGVVNRSPGPGYVLSWDQFVVSDGLADLLRWMKARDWLAVVVTSQKGVGKGLMSQTALDVIHQNLQTTLADEIGSGFDAIYAYTGSPNCPHRPKPDPEMILTATNDFGIDLDRSWMIGDADRDIAMAVAAGVSRTIRVRSENPITVPAMFTVSDLMEAQIVLERETTEESPAQF